MHDWVCRLGSNMRHTPQGLITKEGSNPRAVWDGTTKIEPDDVVMNEVSQSEGEPEVTFGKAKVLFYQCVYCLFALVKILFSNAFIKCSEKCNK